MDVIYLLIPAVIFIGLIMVGVLIWAIRSGQYDDLEGEASRILMDEDLPEGSPPGAGAAQKEKWSGNGPS